MTRRTDGMYAFRGTVPQPSGTGAELKFTEAEVVAFLDGVAKGEFDQETTPDMAVCGKPAPGFVSVDSLHSPRSVTR